MSQLQITAGDSTEELLEFILKELDTDNLLDEVEVERGGVRDSPFGAEPITTTVILTLTPLVVVAVARLIERWLENERQKDQIKLLLRAYELSPEAGDAVSKVVQAHANVALEEGLPSIPSEQTSS